MWFIQYVLKSYFQDVLKVTYSKSPRHAAEALLAVDISPAEAGDVLVPVAAY